MPIANLRLLHLSDLHERGRREHENWRRRRVLGEAWVKNLAVLCADGPPDLVCFTGDVADWGLPEEYSRAGEFLNALLEHLGLPSDRCFVIPGNHDIHRETAAASWNHLRANLPRVTAQDVSYWLAGGPAPLGFTDAHRDDVLSRQAAYRAWVARDLDRSDLLPDPARHPYLGYCRPLRLPGHGFDLHVIGLDSAWLCGDDADSGRLRLTEDQVMRLVTGPGGEDLSGFCLVLVHHPLDDLTDGAACRRLLAPRVDLLLRGHLHDPEPSAWADPERTLYMKVMGGSVALRCRRRAWLDAGPLMRRGQTDRQQRSAAPACRWRARHAPVPWPALPSPPPPPASAAPSRSSQSQASGLFGA